MSRRFTTITVVLVLAVVASILAQGGYPSWAQAVRSESKTDTPPPTSPNPFGVHPPAASPVQPATAKQAAGTSSSPSTGSAGMGAEMGARMGGVMGAMAGEMMMGSEMERGGMMGGSMGPSGGMMYGSGDMMGGSGGMMGGQPGGVLPIQMQLRQEASRLRQAKTVEAKERSKKALEALLGDYFDRDMGRRQAELDQVKQRVARLEALFERRQAAKEEIIELQLKMTVAESEGLGFFSDPASGSFGGYGMGGEGYGMDGGMEGEYGGGYEGMGGYGGSGGGGYGSR